MLPTAARIARMAAFTGLRARLSGLILLTLVPLVVLQLYQLDRRERDEIAAATRCIWLVSPARSRTTSYSRRTTSSTS